MGVTRFKCEQFEVEFGAKHEPKRTYAKLVAEENDGVIERFAEESQKVSDALDGHKILHQVLGSNQRTSKDSDWRTDPMLWGDGQAPRFPEKNSLPTSPSEELQADS